MLCVVYFLLFVAAAATAAVAAAVVVVVVDNNNSKNKPKIIRGGKGMSLYLRNFNFREIKGICVTQSHYNLFRG